MAEHDPRTAKEHAAMRARGLRLRQIWVPDSSAPGFAEEMRRQSALAANSPSEAEDQAFVDALVADAWSHLDDQD